MPDRLIKEQIRFSRSMHMVSPGAFKHWVLMATTADMWGRFPADPDVVLGTCYPYDPRPTIPQVAGWMDELQNAETVAYYEADEKLYGFHPNWRRHNRRTDTKPRYPDPPLTLKVPISMRQVAIEREQARAAASLFANLREPT